MWSYGEQRRTFQLPGPTLCVTSGEKVTVDPAQHAARGRRRSCSPARPACTADGKPAQPQIDDAGDLTSLVHAGGRDRPASVTYKFTAGQPGTYLYQSRHRRHKQQQMGLYGALVVRPGGPPRPGERPRRLGVQPRRTSTCSCSPRSTPTLHLAVERERAVRLEQVPAAVLHDQRPEHAGHAGPEQRGLAAEPALRGDRPHPAVRRRDQPEPGADPVPQRRHRSYPFHPHGSDERSSPGTASPSQGPGGQDLSYHKFLIDVRPGQTRRHADGLATTWSTGTPATQPDPGRSFRSCRTRSLVRARKPGSARAVPRAHRNAAADRASPRTTSAASTTTSPTATPLSRPPTTARAFGGMMTLFRIDPPAGCPR